MAQVALGGFHQIRYQIVATLELYLDLGKAILETVFQRHQFVVDGGDPETQDGKNDKKNYEFHGVPNSCYACGLY